MVKLSIIVPIYGVEKYIEHFSLSLFNQKDIASVEFVFVNDCSQDNSMDVLKGCIEHFQHLTGQVKIIDHERNKGLASARLTGLVNAKGEYVWFVDSDDWLAENAVSLLINIINQQKGYDVVWFSGVYHGKRENEMRNLVTPQTLLTTLTWPTLWCCMVRRQFLYDYSILPIEGLNYGEDRLMTSRIACVAQKQLQIANRLYHYRTDNDNSYSNTVKDAYLLQDALGGKYVYDFYKKHNMLKNNRPALFINQAIRHYYIRNIKTSSASVLRSAIVHNMFNLSRLMTFFYFLIGWLFPLKYRVTFLYYLRSFEYKVLARPYNIIYKFN